MASVAVGRRAGQGEGDPRVRPAEVPQVVGEDALEDGDPGEADPDRSRLTVHWLPGHPQGAVRLRQGSASRPVQGSASRPVRENRRPPTSRSRAWTWALRGDRVMCGRTAARQKCRSSATVTKQLRCRGSTVHSCPSFQSPG